MCRWDKTATENISRVACLRAVSPDAKQIASWERKSRPMVKSAFAGRAARIRHPAFQISPPSSPLSVPYPHPHSARRGATRHESSALAVPRRRRRRRRSFATDNWIPRATPAELQIFPSRENFLADAPLRGDIPRRLYRLRSAAFLSTVREKKDRYVGTEPPLPLPPLPLSLLLHPPRPVHSAKSAFLWFTRRDGVRAPTRSCSWWELARKAHR